MHGPKRKATQMMSVRACAHEVVQYYLLDNFSKILGATCSFLTDTLLLTVANRGLANVVFRLVLIR